MYNKFLFYKNFTYIYVALLVVQKFKTGFIFPGKTRDVRSTTNALMSLSNR
jgi:hypothetical protein